MRIIIAIIILLATSLAAGAQDIDNLDFPPVKDWVDGEVIDEGELDDIEERAEYLRWAAPMPIIVSTEGDGSSSATRNVDLTLPDMTDWMVAGPTLGLCIRVQVNFDQLSTNGAQYYYVGWRRDQNVSLPNNSNPNLPDGLQQIGSGTLDPQGWWWENYASATTEGTARISVLGTPYTYSKDRSDPRGNITGEYCWNTGHLSTSTYLDTLNVFMRVTNVQTLNNHEFNVTFIVRPYFHYDYS